MYEPKTKSSTEQQADQTGETVHVPVLLQSVIQCCEPGSGHTVFDGTYGAGGYSDALLEIVAETGIVIATDQDPEVINRSQNQTSNRPKNLLLHHANFSQIDEVLEKEGIAQIDCAVLDLGISSDQLEDETRGISFKHLDAPLDMRMNNSEGNDLTAWGIINVWEEEEIANMLYNNADEHKSRRIARNIVEQRKRGSIETVGDLINIIHQSIGSGGKTNSATKTFQALRIEVNRELAHLQTFLEKVIPLLKTCGKLGIVSFHSIEDRIVKQTFRQWKQEEIGVIITKKPISPTREELQKNKRARSAKLRVFQKGKEC